VAEGTDPHPANVPGPWFVDRRCIDCDAMRQVAPELFERVDRQSVIRRQPATPEEEERMWLAALACPTNSVRRDPPRSRPTDLYPHEFADGVHHCGYNSPDSYGANAFLAVRDAGNVMVDAPRFVRPLVERIAALGGLDHVLLTHRDDVADADRWAERFGARVWIHAADADAAPFATDVVDGEDPIAIRDDLLLVPCPGHTRGSVLFLLEERFLFTGDSLYWSRTHDDLAVHLRQTWFSLDVQLASLGRVAREHRFSAVLAGHGSRHETTVEDMHARLEALVERSRAARSVAP
jgi:glyoxylase-like metal-dependent hydrolase (beta-lactamase superfamily II)